MNDEHRATLRITRRGLVGAAAAGALTLDQACAAARRVRAGPVEADAVSRLVALVDAASGRHADALAAAYSRTEDPGSDAARLLAALRESLGLSLAAIAAGRREDLEARMEQACRRDFAAGDMVVLEGWCLARSEARLLALARTV